MQTELIEGRPLRVAITGGCGFIGTHVVKRALHNGFHVLNVDCLSYAANTNNHDTTSQLYEHYQFEKLDIRDQDHLNRVFNVFKPDGIIHLAAESHVDRSIDRPSDFVTTNVIGTYNLLEYVRSAGISGGAGQVRFLHVSTDEVYGSLGSSGLFTETTAYNPNSPYSASKASSDHLAYAWHKTYDLDVVITNCSNNYGPYQYPEKLLPVVIHNGLNKQPIPIYGDGKNIRDWLFVEDHADALIQVLLKAEKGEKFNIGGNQELTNMSLVKMVCEILDQSTSTKFAHDTLITFVTDRPGHDRRYAIDSTKIKTKLGWQPKYDIRHGLKTTVEWYLSNGDWLESIGKRNQIGHRQGNLSKSSI